MDTACGVTYSCQEAVDFECVGGRASSFGEVLRVESVYAVDCKVGRVIYAAAEQHLSRVSSFREKAHG